MTNRIGQQLGNYHLTRLLGRGGFAEVYLGEHVHLQSQAAIKILRAVLSQEQQAAFLQEARTLVHLRHPHIVRLLDFAVQDDLAFLVMEYAPHGSLLDRHPRGERLPVESVIIYVRQIASALQYAHEQRLIHRDVKPANLLLGPREEVLLSDFGLATLLTSTSSESQPAVELALQGTAPYLAPEQLRGKPRAASDQYALGIVVYEWLCGRPPFWGTVTEVAMQHLSAPPPPLREHVPDLPSDLEAVVLRALAKEPRQRFANIQDFASALEQAADQATYATQPTPVSPLEQHIPPTLLHAIESSPALWNVPYQRYPLFTGRESLLQHLRSHFASGRPIALNQSQALSGLGGIGKTQLAVEYAYRYRQHYQAVLWVRAASRDTLIADFVSMASLLHLPEQADQDQLRVVEALKRWLTQHTGWLLILDNADDLSMVAEFLPAGGEGHVLLTTRAQATGKLASSLPVERMDEEEGTTLLLRRAKLLAASAALESVAPAVYSQAQAMVRVLDGLPLALDQAGAYIEETGCSLSEYLELYQRRRSRLLARQSSLSSEYPYTVASTWSLSFQQVEQADLAAADLLRLCAFLDPDAIPEVILTAGASFLGPVLGPVAADTLLLHEVIQVLRRFSLLKRDPEAKLLNIHRLVQAVLKDGMEIQVQRQWAERVVRAVNAAFPEVTFAAWPRCQECLPHALACAEFIDEYHLAFPEAARLLYHVGWYLGERGHYAQAEPLLQRALTIREQVLGSEHLDTAAIFDRLAWLYTVEGKYEQSEALYQRALAMKELALGHAHPDIVVTLNSLAWLYLDQGRYESAEALLQRALTIKGHALGPEDRDMAETINVLARLHFLQGKYGSSEALLRRALAISEHVWGPEHPETAILFSDLAYLSRFQGNYEQSEALHQHALRLLEHTFGPGHPETAFTLDSLASLYVLQGKHEQAWPLYQRALALREQTRGPEHPDTASTIDNLALVCRAHGDYSQAEALHQRALAIREQKLGPEHPDTMVSLVNLADVYTAQQKYEQAEALYRRALAVREQVLGPEHPDTATTLDHLATLYQDRGQYEQAEPLYQRALAIREQALGPEHPDTVSARTRSTSLQEQIQQASGKTSHEPQPVLGGSSPTPSTKKSASYPAGLTAREVEVLCLVAQGLTNPQIAGQLVLSEKTVINHLTHIFNKIGCDNRTAATAFAIRHALA